MLVFSRNKKTELLKPKQRILNQKVFDKSSDLRAHRHSYLKPRNTSFTRGLKNSFSWFHHLCLSQRRQIFRGKHGSWVLWGVFNHLRYSKNELEPLVLKGIDGIFETTTKYRFQKFKAAWTSCEAKAGSKFSRNLPRALNRYSYSAEPSDFFSSLPTIFWWKCWKKDEIFRSFES